MDFNIKTGQPEKQRTDCLLLPVFESGKLPVFVAAIDKLCHGKITEVIKSGDMSGKLGTQSMIHTPMPNIARILLVGCGKKSDFADEQYRKAMHKAIAILATTGAKDAYCTLPMLEVGGRDLAWKIQQATVIASSVTYKFLEYKSDKSKEFIKLKKINWMVTSPKEQQIAQNAVQIGAAIANGMKITKDLANTPPNICHPTFLAKHAMSIAKKYKKVSCAILNKKDLAALKMGAFLAVTQGSVQPPKLITLEYRGAAKKDKPVVFVGKGITFDTGGNSLKPAANMIGMKYDMCGAATVLGLISFAAEAKLPINVVGVIAAAENMPGGEACRPDDIVTTMSKLTVEILNTDAEGRLVLCDALTYTERFDPKVVIDIATLTGACVVALGNHHSGLFSNHQPLADLLLKAGQISGDKCWQMPITDDYMAQLDSNFADISNIGGAEAGSITAACFLSRFTTKYHWAHLDVAGTACRFIGKERGATGQPLPLLAEFLLMEAN